MGSLYRESQSPQPRCPSSLKFQPNFICSYYGLHLRRMDTPTPTTLKKKKGKQEGAHGEKALREGNRVTQLETLIFKGSACIFCYRLFVWWP